MPQTEHYLKRELDHLLQSTPEIFHFLESGSLDGLWYWDLERPEHEWMSARFWETFGYDAREKQHLTQEWQDMIHPEDLQAALASAQAHFADPNVPYDQEVRYRHKDGSTVWVRCRGLAIRNDQGQPVRMLGAHTDITDLKNKEQRLRAIFHALPGLVFVLDQEGRYLDAVANRESLLAAPPELFLGRTMEEILPPDNAQMQMQALTLAFQEGSTQTTEYALDLPPGRRWFEARISPMEAPYKDAPRAAVVIVHDITDRKQLQLQLERSNRDLEEFAYAASHDLQAPLRAISQLTDWLQDDEAHLSEEGAEHLRLIQQRTQRMGGLIQGLLDFSRVGRGYAPQPIDSQEHTLQVMQLLEYDPDTVEITLAPQMPLIQADPRLWRQIMQNLLQNAIQHNDKAQTRVHVGWEQDDHSWRFTVSDNGPGIPPRSRERIFQIFQTLAPRDELDTSGVGLSLVRKAVQLSGGAIEISDGDLGGACFRFTLPRHHEAL